MKLSPVIFGVALTFAAAISAAPCAAEAPQAISSDEQAARPVVVFIETNPWLMVIGSDVPSFVLYDDGAVIYRKGENFLTAVLPANEMARIVASARLADEVVNIEVSDWTDQPTTSVLLSANGKVSGVRIYGRVPSGESQGKLSQQMIDTVLALREFEVADAKPWLPKNIEVMIWPYEYAPEASIDWPRDWPGLKDPATVQRGDGYSLFLPSVHLAELKALLARQKERGAVKIGGHKWAVAWRLPFPGVR